MTRWLGLIILAGFLCQEIPAAGPIEGWRYQLLYPSAMSYAIDGVVKSFSAARGHFDLTERQGDYEVHPLKITAFGGTEFNGNGSLEVSPAGVMKITLELAINGRALRFTNFPGTVDRKWPMVVARARSEPLDGKVYTIQLAAAPFHDVWVSPALNFRTAAGATINEGDLLSVSGRVIRSHKGGLDAVSLATGGLAVSETASDGEIALPDGSRLSYTNIFPGAAEDPGIDGLQILSPARFYFSVKRDFVYQQLPIRDGDILLYDAETRAVTRVRSREELFSYREFDPFRADPAVGVDSFYIWPWGETWFSLRSSWTAHTAIYSTEGYGVYTDTFAFEAFHPDIDPGLDAFVVITDADARSGQPRLQLNGGSLLWPATGGAYQLESADSINGPFAPATAITPERAFEIPFGSPARFFRLRQW